MGNGGTSLSQPSGHSLKHIPHGSLPVQHRPGLLIRSNITLNLLFHLIADPLKINNLQQHIIYLLTQQLVLSIVLRIIILKRILFQNSMVKLILNTPQVIFPYLDLFGLLLVLDNKLVQLITGTLQFQLLFVTLFL